MEARELRSLIGHSLPSGQPKRDQGHKQPHRQMRCGTSLEAGITAMNKCCPYFRGRPLSRAVKTRGKNFVHGFVEIMEV